MLPPLLYETCLTTSLVAAGMKPLLAKRAIFVCSKQIFARYSDQALDLKMEEASEYLDSLSKESCSLDKRKHRQVQKRLIKLSR